MYHPRRRKIYLAARFSRQAEMREVRAALHAIGYEVISSWLDEDNSLDGKLDRAASTRICRLVCDEILRVSVFVCFLDKKPGSGRGGHQAEFGYAFAKGKVVISVGTAERNIFHDDFRVRQFATTEEFLKAAQSWTNFLPPLSSSTEPAGHSVV